MNSLKEFGNQIRKNRIAMKESLQEMAEAIGVNHSYLSRLENGLRRPSYDIVLLLIRHFSLSGVKAMELASLSGYSAPVLLSQNQSSGVVNAGTLSANAAPKQGLRYELKSGDRKEDEKPMEEQTKPQNDPNQLQIVMPQGTPVLYTDSCFVTDSQFGIVMDFAQRMGPTNQQTIVSRVGMSVEHAEALVKVLSQKIIESKLKAKKEKVNKTN